MRVRTLTILLMLSCILPAAAAAQNFTKVIEIVGGMEESMKSLIANEERARVQQIAELRSDITTLKSTLFRTDGIQRTPEMLASADAHSVMDRLEQLEVRMNGGSAASPEMMQLADQLGSLVGELKKVVEEGKQLQLKQAAAAPAAPLYTITGQIRHRGEVDGRSFTPEAHALGYNLLRTRFNVAIVPSPEAKIFLQLQDSRTFGAGTPTLLRGANDGMSKAIEFHQAYFSLVNLFSEPLTLRVGRQELIYGNQRFVTAAGWNNIGFTFDAVTATYSGASWSADAFFAKLVGSTTATAAENFTGTYAKWRYAGPHSVEGFFFYDNNTTVLTKGPDKGNTRMDRSTIGLTFLGKPEVFDYSTEFVNQRGSLALTDSSSRSDINAYLVAFIGGYTIDPASKLRIGMKYEVMSGDDDPKGGEYNVLNTLFTATHLFLGYMDYFPKTFTENGIRSLSLNAAMEFSPVLNGTFDVYRFSTHREAVVKLANGTTYRSFDMGYEADLIMTYKYTAGIALNGGFGLYVPQGAMSALKGPALGYWSYCMTTVNF